MGFSPIKPDGCAPIGLKYLKLIIFHLLCELLNKPERIFSIANFVSEESKTEIDIEKSADGVPAHFDENFISIMETTAKDILPGKYKLMSSGAQHDAQVFASIIPTAMVFVPSINGVSHHWTENTSDEDIVNGFEYFVEAMRRILQSRSK